MPEPVKKASAKKAAATKPQTKADDDAITGVIETYVEKGAVALGEYAALARRAAQRLAGDDRAGIGGWTDDAVSFWGKVARDQMNAMTFGYELMTATSRRADELVDDE